MNTACFNLLYSKILYLKSFKPLPAIPPSPRKRQKKKTNSLLFLKKQGKKLSNLKSRSVARRMFFFFRLFFQCLNKVKSWSSGGDDVTVGLSLGDLDGLLLLEDQETIKFGSCLFLVVVPAQLKQADRVGTGLGHDALRGRGEHATPRLSSLSVISQSSFFISGETDALNAATPKDSPIVDFIKRQISMTIVRAQSLIRK